MEESISNVTSHLYIREHVKSALAGVATGSEKYSLTHLAYCLPHIEACSIDSVG